MTRTCILHLGMNKTGTTTIQRAFHKMRTPEISYFKNRYPNHTYLIREMFPKPEANARDTSIRPWPHGPEAMAKAEELRNSFRDRLAAQPGDVVISAETLSGPQFPQEAANMLVALLREQFDRVRAIAYLRAPASYMKSAMLQGVRGGIVDFRIRRLYPKYRQRFEKWLIALGEENVDLALFAPEAFAGGDLIADFAGRLGVAPPPAPEPQNTSLSAEGFAVLYAYRLSQLGPDARGKVEPNQAGLNALAEFGATSYELAPRKVAHVLEKWAEDIAWAEERIGRPFPPHAPRKGAVVFGRQQKILDFAMTQEEAFRAFVAATPLHRPDTRLGLRKIERALYRSGN